MFRITISIFILLIVCFAIPNQINYQGKITDDSGVAITGTADIEFRIYNIDTGGSPIWSESHTDVEVVKGLFDVILGSINPLTLSFDTTYYIELVVNGEVLSPRNPLLSVPYAFRADFADHSTFTDTIHHIDSVSYIDSVNYIDSITYIDSVSYIDYMRIIELIHSIDSITHIDSINYADSINYIDTINYVDSIGYIDSIGYVEHTNYADSAGRLVNSLTAGPGILGSPFDGSVARTWAVYLSSLGDVDTSGITNGKILKWNGSGWIASEDDTGSGGGTTYWTMSGSNLYPNDTGWNVGIGTTTPAQKLDVEGKTKLNGTVEIDSTLNMTKHQIQNMVIENRTTDPVSPVIGQIWIRTDL